MHEGMGLGLGLGKLSVISYQLLGTIKERFQKQITDNRSLITRHRVVVFKSTT